jgi:hypothetical protein
MPPSVLNDPAKTPKGCGMTVSLAAARPDRNSVAAWIGLVVVIENILSSTVRTHLFDFDKGWLYVFGVGLAGGAVLRERLWLAQPR